MRLDVDIEDKRVDETWLELAFEDIWEAVKKVRNKSGPRQLVVGMWFGTTHLTLTVRREQP